MIVGAVVALGATVSHEVLADLPSLLLGHVMAIRTIFTLRRGGGGVEEGLEGEGHGRGEEGREDRRGK